MNAETPPAPGSTAWYVGHVTADAALLADAVAAGPLDAAVAACPGWNLGKLAEHIGYVHRWAAHNATRTTPPERGTIAGAPADLSAVELADWVRDGAGALADVLGTIDPNAPTWHPFPVPMVAGVWPRRQAHETAVHRWDAQTAVGSPTPIDADLASDGIDEFLSIAIPRIMSREGATAPTGSVHVHCTDVAGEWLAWFDADGYHLTREHRKGDVALRGPAASLLLVLYGRDADRSDVTHAGQHEVLQQWFELPGL